MEYNDYNLNESYDEQKRQLRLAEEAKKIDRGYNVIYRTVPNKKGILVKTPISIYTSSGTDSNIRDAETGAYYSHLVGSADEDLYFKVVLATGECKSKNGSSTLFYLTPRHYMSHLNCEVDDEIVQIWQEKRDARYKAIELKKISPTSIIIN